MGTSPEALIKKIEASRVPLLRLYRSVPVTALLEPTLPNGWSVKDLLGHIATWEWAGAEQLNKAAQSDEPIQTEFEVDAVNRASYEERREWDWEEVEADFNQAHQAMLAAIRLLPSEKLADETLQQVIAGETWEHYEEHLPELERWHKRVAK
jgi:hypothetical protein